MDRNQAKEFYSVLQAYAEGKVIRNEFTSTVYGRSICSLSSVG